jgi:hypothetical protein
VVRLLAQHVAHAQHLVLAALIRPSHEVMSPLRQQRAQGSRVPIAPMVRVQQKARGRTTGDSRTTGLPAQWVTGLYVISPGTGSLAPVARNARHEHRQLDLSSGRPGPHDFAVRDMPFVSRHTTSIASRPNTRDDREAPLFTGPRRAKM